MTKYNKREILKRIIQIPPNQRAVFLKNLNYLMTSKENYPNMEFWSKVNFNQEWDSSYIKIRLRKKILEKKYNRISL